MDTLYSDKRTYLYEAEEERIYVMYPTEIYHVGHILAPRIKKVLDIDGYHSVDYVLAQIAMGIMPVIIFEVKGEIDLFTVAAINEFSLKKIYNIFIAEGEGLVKRPKHITSHIEKYAKSLQCDCVEIIGRKGYVKILPDYKQTDVVLRKNL